MSRRSDTVRKAINRYNEQALLLDPPAPAVDWREIAEYTFIGEFDILRIARSDVRKERWTQKANRGAAIKYFKLCRAREEIQRLNVEVCRLLTFICEETEHTEQVIEQLSIDDPPLADELRKRWSLRSSVNAVHLQRLKILQSKAYYTGRQDYDDTAGVLQFTSNSDSQGITQLEQDDQIAAENARERDFEYVANFVANIND
jgi:hypothetical protein